MSLLNGFTVLSPYLQSSWLLSKHGGNVSAAVRELGIARKTLDQPQK